ncbi:BrnA antitoxin family protein [Rhodoferax lithotrophicus]|uniref:BrnA antitoxin family protein n=1 Tax=Rhodoferax lithotrophicus TaxID=2798804 RepID=UPI00293913E5|nr:BrnA antitoxin family protein [Rhodoferax sp. MIZ03]
MAAQFCCLKSAFWMAIQQGEILQNGLCQTCPACLASPLQRPQHIPRRSRLRLDSDVLAALRATGRSWQTRVNDRMREWKNTHTAA